MFKVPAYWVITIDERKFHKFPLSTSSKEYKDVEAAFRATAPNQIVSIERIQNKGHFELYKVKREGMIKKYGSIAGKEKMLFHGTSVQNLEKINADGLNRIYAGTHGKTEAPPCPLIYEIVHLYLCHDFLCVSLI